jgi:ubiquinol-cytochrome c reductase cytochrome b subunit
VLLGYCGAQTTDAVWTLVGVDIPLLWISRLATLFYFAFFWVLMPWIGKIEVTKPLPDSIAQSVLGKTEDGV